MFFFVFVFRPSRDEPIEALELKINNPHKMDRDTSNRRRKFKDSLLDESNDFHWLKGFHRKDLLARIREVAVTTNATRLLADPCTYAQFQTFMPRYTIVTYYLIST